MKTVRIVTATTEDEAHFQQFSMLGRSLSVFPTRSNLQISILFNNYGKMRKGLSKFYKFFLQPKYKEEILLFVHDDVYLNDWHIVYNELAQIRPINHVLK